MPSEGSPLIQTKKETSQAAGGDALEPVKQAHLLTHVVLAGSSLAVPVLTFFLYWLSGASVAKSGYIAGATAVWGIVCYLFMTKWQYALGSPLASWGVVVVNLIWPAVLVASCRDYFVVGGGLSMEMLTLIQATRFMGTLFIFENGRGNTGTVFAYTAGFGDFMAAVIGVTILVQLLTGGQPNNGTYLFLIGFGLFDFVVAFSLSILSTRRIPFQLLALEETHLMTEYPLALLPQYLVPYATAAHILMLLSLP